MNCQINFNEIFRWASRNKTITFLSITGMAIGIAISLLIGFWGLNEFSFDNQHVDADRIFRVCRQGYINNESVTLGSDFGPVGTTAKQQFPEIEEICRVVVLDREAIKIKGTNSFEDHFCAVDANFFRFFSFKLKNGDPKTCLDSPDKIIIDCNLSDKYFSNENPVGQVIEIYGQKYQVSAVMENVPANSHLKFNMLLPITSLSWLRESKWGSNDNFLTYLKLNENADSKKLAGEITKMTYQHFPIYKQFEISHFLQPLADIHFSPGFRFDYVVTSDRRIIIIFISLAAIILLIACFNFINLFISSSFLRAKSVGIKKINGSSKISLFYGSYIETGFYVLIATILAILLLFIALPLFNQISGANLKIDLTDYRIYLFSGILLLLTVTIAGSVPVWYMLRFSPEAIIRNQFKGTGITLLQRVLVIGQFVASIVLITSAGMIKKQINFIQNKDLGFNKEHIIYFNARNLAAHYEPIREELLKNPNIVDITSKSCLPFEWNNGNSIQDIENPSSDIIMEICEIKPNYPDMMGIRLAEGKNPFKPTGNNNTECLINEQAAINLGMTNPVGKQIKRSGENEATYTIAGVLKNANTKSLHLSVDPQVYVPSNTVRGYHSILIKTTGNTESLIKILTEIWDKNNPDVPFEYHFLDDAYNSMYKTEKIASRIVSIGMIIAIFLAFMGLFAISHYATERRVKEIGVRKVNGATIQEMIIMLNRSFIFWIGISFTIASPVTFLVMNKWLENFAYKTNLSWWIFALSGLVALGIALLTVSWQSWRAATKNPVEALRYE